MILSYLCNSTERDGRDSCLSAHSRMHFHSTEWNGASLSRHVYSLRSPRYALGGGETALRGDSTLRIFLVVPEVTLRCIIAVRSTM